MRSRLGLEDWSDPWLYYSRDGDLTKMHLNNRLVLMVMLNGHVRYGSLSLSLYDDINIWYYLWYYLVMGWLAAGSARWILFSYLWFRNQYKVCHKFIHSSRLIHIIDYYFIRPATSRPAEEKRVFSKDDTNIDCSFEIPVGWVGAVLPGCWVNTRVRYAGKKSLARLENDQA